MAKQYEQQVRQERPQSSQLFKLLSPGAEADNINITSPGLPPTSATPTDSTAETRTAIISKQSLVSNMSLPMIRLSRSEDNSQQQPLFVTASSLSGAPILSSLPPSDTAEKIILRTSDKSIMKLTQADLKNLIAGGRGIQLFTGLPGQTPVNIVVKKPEDCNPTSSVSVPDAANEALTTILPSADPAVSTPSIVLPSTDTTKLINLTQAEIPTLIETQVAEVLATSSIPEIVTAEIDSCVEQAEGVEPMEVDTEEEMSGLLISSTFSVCPTSGERVVPSTDETSAFPTISDAAEIPVVESSSNEDALLVSTNELLSVPIVIESNSTNDLSVDVSTVVATPTSESKELDLDETFKQVLASAQDSSSAEAATAVSSPQQTTDLVPIQDKSTANDAPVITPNKATELNLDETFEQVLSTAQDASSSDAADEASSTQKSKTLVPVQDKSDSVNDLPVEVSTAASDKSKELNPDETLEQVLSTAQDASSSDTTNAASSSTQQSKSKPVRRSARLKSGV